MEKIIIEWNTVSGDGDYVDESDDYDKYNDVNERQIDDDNDYCDDE